MLFSFVLLRILNNFSMFLTIVILSKELEYIQCNVEFAASGAVIQNSINSYRVVASFFAGRRWNFRFRRPDMLPKREARDK